jgi:hypothetical protein
MRLLLAAALFLASLPGQAATPGAWAALDTAARKACKRDIQRIASRARIGDISGRVSGIGEARDSDRFYALLLTGRTANFPSQWLCLYDKRAKTATAREIEKR